MKGITEERLRDLIEESRFPVTMGYLIHECTELNPWKPIESAPKDRPVLLYGGHVPCCQMFVGDANAAWSWQPTHWCELPEDPK